jgi:phosphomannomutase
MKFSIQELMNHSGVAFGTSGARGLAITMTDLVCYAYARAFLQYLEYIGELKRAGERVAVAGDFRPSTDRIMEAVMRAIEDLGYQPVNGGKIPSPAVALYGLEQHIPSIMITGSHIPDDRNGIKFNKCAGEVLKSDEKGMSSQEVILDDSLFSTDGSFTRPGAQAHPVVPEPRDNYVRRYLSFFTHDALHGVRVGVYQHSAVGRDLLVEILSGLGAQVTPLARSEAFIPVDTEAIRPEDARLAAEWARTGHFDALVSTDGDSDRPLVSDEKGDWLRGDIAGILCARFWGAESVCTPISCNTAVEKCHWFKEIRRTRIGSPFVITAMNEATAAGAHRVVGYEANGGFLLASDLLTGGKKLRALPTRDAVIVILGILLLAKQQRKTISQLTASLPPRFTASDRLKDFPTDKSRAILERFTSGSETADKAALEKVLGGICGAVASLNRTDGLRISFANGEIIHLRPSGNAPEFRCYGEAGTDERAREIIARALAQIRAQA